MTGPEGRLWEALRPNLVSWGMDPQRVENGLGEGTPDVNYTRGWLELKVAVAPRRPTTPVHIRWERGQKPWQTQRWAAGGLVFTLVSVGKGYLLLDGGTVGRLAGEETLAELKRVALVSTDSLADARLWLCLNGAETCMEPSLRSRWYRLRAGWAVAHVGKTFLGWTAEQVERAESGEDKELAEALAEAWEV